MPHFVYSSIISLAKLVKGIDFIQRNAEGCAVCELDAIGIQYSLACELKATGLGVEDIDVVIVTSGQDFVGIELQASDHM